MNNSNLRKKPFPWCCSKCEEQAVYGAIVDYTRTMHHDGRDYVIHIADLKTPKCVNCGQVMLDSEALEVFDVALRACAHLLTPEQIRDGRLQANLSQQELAAALGVDEHAVERWESGLQFQSRSHDRLLRLFFHSAQVREFLAEQEKHLAVLDQMVPLEKLEEQRS